MGRDPEGVDPGSEDPGSEDPEGTNPKSADLGDVDSKCVELRSANLRETNPGGADLGSADPKCVDPGTDLGRVDLERRGSRIADLRSTVLIPFPLGRSHSSGLKPRLQNASIFQELP